MAFLKGMKNLLVLIVSVWMDGWMDSRINRWLGSEESFF